MFWHFLEMSICYEDREKDDEFLLIFLLPLGCRSLLSSNIPIFWVFNAVFILLSWTTGPSVLSKTMELI